MHFMLINLPNCSTSLFSGQLTLALTLSVDPILTHNSDYITDPCAKYRNFKNCLPKIPPQTPLPLYFVIQKF